MFYEVGIKRSRSGWGGDIALATSRDGISWFDRGVVLSENDVVLSFPIVFKDEDSFYMTVDSRSENNVRLFSTRTFPYGWSSVDTLIVGQWNDPVVTYQDSTYYLFTSKY